MRRIIHKIRMQPPEFRVIIAVLLALVMTSIIGYFWVGTLSTSTFQKETTETESPFQSLVTNIKDVVSQSKEENPSPFTEENAVEITNEYDESNPANQ